MTITRLVMLISQFNEMQGWNLEDTEILALAEFIFEDMDI